LIFFSTNYLESNILSQILFISAGTLGFYNFILGLFNLIPAYPTDGGRLVRATLAKYMEYGKATSHASNIGKGIAISMAIFGIITLNIWLVLISVFLFFGATQEEKMVKISLALKDKKVKDLMNKKIKSVPPGKNIKDFIEFIKEERNLIYPVTENNKLIGIVTIDDVKDASRENIEDIQIKDIMREDFSKISLDKKAISAFKQLSRSKYNHLFVEKEDKLVGVISFKDLSHALKMSKI